MFRKSSYSNQENSQNKRAKTGIASGVVGLIFNLVLAVIKIFAGLIAGSVSIMADAMNNLADSGGNVLSIGGFYVANKPPDREHPYGHQRAEYISGLLVSIIILFVGFQFLLSSIEKIFNPTSVETSSLVLVLLIISVLLKGILGFYYRRKTQELNSSAIAALMKDSIYDVAMTLVVLFSYIIEIQFGWYVDGYAGVLVALFIIYGGVISIIDSSSDLLGTRPDPKMVDDMKNILDSYHSLIGYHDLIIHNYGPNKTFATVDIEIDSSWTLHEAHEVINNIEKEFSENLGITLVSHMDPIELYDENQNEMHALVKRILKSYDKNFHFHDFRMENDDEEKEIHFDVVVPESVSISDEVLYDKITRDIYKEINDYTVYITFDRNYILEN